MLLYSTVLYKKCRTVLEDPEGETSSIFHGREEVRALCVLSTKIWYIEQYAVSFTVCITVCLQVVNI